VIVTAMALMNESSSHFFHMGPSKDLIFIGIQLDTFYKYNLFCIFCFTNSLMRKINNNILIPWITLVVQDESKVKPEDMHFDAYLITNISNLYTWVDWILYMNILFTQIDIIFVEIVADLIVLNTSTYYYLHPMYLKLPVEDKDLELIPTNLASHF
jgi:hypothetical protein